MKILCLLQNSWFKHVDKIRDMLGRHDEDPDFEDKFMQKAFIASHSGEIMKNQFLCYVPEEIQKKFVWGNASKEIASSPSACPKYDLEHVQGLIDKVNPVIIIAFGTVAAKAVIHTTWNGVFITGPHPSARMDKVAAYKRMTDELLKFFSVDKTTMTTQHGKDTDGRGERENSIFDPELGKCEGGGKA